MKVRKAGPTTMVSRAKELYKEDAKDGDTATMTSRAGVMGMGGRYKDEGGDEGRGRGGEVRKRRDLPQ